MSREVMGSSDKKSVPTGIAEGLPPVAPPDAEGGEDDKAPSIVKEEPTASEVFFAWEKLRLTYNGLLILLVLSMAIKSGFSPLAGVFFVFDAIIANMCFCAGSVAEGYLCLLGLPRQACRWCVFWFGFVLTVPFAIQATEEILKRLDK